MKGNFLGLLLVLVVCCLGCGDSHTVGVGGGSSQKSDEISREVTQRSKRLTVDRRASTTIAVAARPLILETFRAQIRGREPEIHATISDKWPQFDHLDLAYLLTLPAEPLVAWPRNLMGSDLHLTQIGRHWCAWRTALAEVGAQVFLDLSVNLRGEIIADREAAMGRIWQDFVQLDSQKISAAIDERLSHYLHSDFLVEVTGGPPSWQFPMDGVRVLGSPAGMVMVRRGVEQWSERLLCGQSVDLTLASTRGLQMDRGRTVETAEVTSAGQDSHGNVAVGKK